MRFWIGIPNNAGSKFYTVIQTAVIFFFYNFLDIFDIPYWNLCAAPCSVLLSEQCNNNDITLFKTDCLIRQ